MDNRRLIERLLRLTSIKCLSGQEAAVADAIQSELAAAGIAVRRLGDNVVCEIGDAPRPRLLVNSHLDTVPPAAGWTSDPWTPRWENRRITALGANDAKASVCAMIEAVLALRESQSRGIACEGTVILALTTEEETTGRGLRETLPALLPIDAALVGEPTDLIPMIAQRGLLILRCTARGRTSHPANTPANTGDNAIINALQAVAQLRSFDWGPPHAMLGACHAHVTKIAGGVATNVIPDACEFWVDVRTTPEQPHQEIVEQLRSHLACEVQVHSDRMAPVHTEPGAAIVRAIRLVFPEREPRGSATMSDMVTLQGIPSVKIGPGLSARSHTPDEYITIDELMAGAVAYERICRAYFQECAAEEGRHGSGADHGRATMGQGPPAR
ncbi:Acetylornithine deacetylase [Phycisphaerae bacterium RAS1]|nr:Acetylornithine deacetylase [Phycisphaerae bacterium RAS1]